MVSAEQRIGPDLIKKSDVSGAIISVLLDGSQALDDLIELVQVAHAQHGLKSEFETEFNQAPLGRAEIVAELGALVREETLVQDPNFIYPKNPFYSLSDEEYDPPIGGTD